MAEDNDTLKIYRRKARTYAQKLQEYTKTNVYGRPESALRAPFDTRTYTTLKKKIAHLAGVRHVVLVGIGGSSQGVEAVYGALKETATASLLTLDTIDDVRIGELTALLKKAKSASDMAFVIVSKSGTTTETLVNGTLALTLAEKRFGADLWKQVVMIGAESSPAASLAKKHKVTWIPFPDTIGGRYSVFTAVGVVPLMLLGIDSAAFLAGARKIIDVETLTEATSGACALADEASKGATVLDLFVFDRHLEGYARWYRQLLAESVGKSTTKKGLPFTKSLLPTVSSAVDLHSVAQLYLSGRRGIFTRFLDAERSDVADTLGNHWLLSGVPSLSATTAPRVMDAIRDGVVLAYADAGLPHGILILRRRSPEELGRIMACAMAEVMILAHLFDINAFDQPNVESYKKHTRELLSE